MFGPVGGSEQQPGVIEDPLARGLPDAVAAVAGWRNVAVASCVAADGLEVLKWAQAKFSALLPDPKLEGRFTECLDEVLDGAVDSERPVEDRKPDQATLGTDRQDGLMNGTDRLRGILDLIEESLNEPELTGAEFAGRAFLSRFHFDRLVTAAWGEPPASFRRRLLLERAAHRLATTPDPVIDVALGAGYGSPEAFTRAFVRASGTPPSGYRSNRTAAHDLPAASGVHFHPPGGLRLPAQKRSDTMDVLTRVYDHHIWLVGEIIDRTAGLDDGVLDRPIEQSVEGIDESPTLRGLSNRLVGQLEMWLTALDGDTLVPTAGDTSPAGLRSRLDVSAPRFREVVLTPIDDYPPHE